MNQNFQKSRGITEQQKKQIKQLQTKQMKVEDNVSSLMSSSKNEILNINEKYKKSLFDIMQLEDDYHTLKLSFEINILKLQITKQTLLNLLSHFKDNNKKQYMCEISALSKYCWNYYLFDRSFEIYELDIDQLLK